MKWRGGEVEVKAKVEVKEVDPVEMAERVTLVNVKTF